MISFPSPSIPPPHPTHCHPSSYSFLSSLIPLRLQFEFVALRVSWELRERGWGFRGHFGVRWPHQTKKKPDLNWPIAPMKMTHFCPLRPTFTDLKIPLFIYLPNHILDRRKGTTPSFVLRIPEVERPSSYWKAVSWTRSQTCNLQLLFSDNRDNWFSDTMRRLYQFLLHKYANAAWLI